MAKLPSQPVVGKTTIHKLNMNDDADSTDLGACRIRVLQKKLNTPKVLDESLLPSDGKIDTDAFVVNDLPPCEVLRRCGTPSRWKNIQITSILEKHLFIAESNCVKGEWGIYTRKFIAKYTILGVYYGDIFVMSNKDRANNNLHLHQTVDFLNQDQQTLHVRPNKNSFFQYANEKFAFNNCALINPLSTFPFKYSPKIRLSFKKKKKLWHTPNYKIISHQQLQFFEANDYLQEVLYIEDALCRRKYLSFRKQIHKNLQTYPLVISTQDIHAYSEIFIDYGSIYPREHYENNMNYII